MSGLEACLDAGVGESRLALLSNGRLLSMQIARDGDGVAAGTIIDARLTTAAGPRGFAVADGQQLLVQPWPRGGCEGAVARLEVTRGAWLEPGRERIAKARPAADAALKPAPALADQAKAAGATITSGWPDSVAEQWQQAWEQAELGRWPIPGGTLTLQPTPAFLAVDVDGPNPDPVAACAALAQLVRLWGLSGSIVADLPAMDRATRTACADTIDTALAGQKFERTAINGFGLVQLVLPRRGPSLLERALLDRAGSAAIALLAAAAREPRPGELLLTARPAVARWLTSRPHLLAQLSRKTGRAVDVASDAVAGAGHVSARS